MSVGTISSIWRNLILPLCFRLTCMSDTVLSDCSSAAVGKISTQIDLLNYIYPKKRQRRVLSFLYLNKWRVHWGIPLSSLSKYFYPCTPTLVRPSLFPHCLRYSGFTFFSVGLSCSHPPQQVIPFVSFVYTYFVIWIQFVVLSNQNALCIL